MAELDERGQPISRPGPDDPASAGGRWAQDADQAEVASETTGDRYTAPLLLLPSGQPQVRERIVALEDFHDRGMGRLYAPDVRDDRFRMTAAPLTFPDLAQTENTNYYYWAGPILDQNGHPHCVAYAWRQWMNTAPLKTRPFAGIQPPTLYAMAQQIDEWPGEDYDGTSVRAGVKVLQQHRHVQNYYWARTTDEVVRWLLGGHGTVVLGTVWTTGMSYPDRDGIIRPTGAIVGGHAYLAGGVNLRTGLVRIINSWGRGWGEFGRAWLPISYLQELLDDWGEACAAIEQRVAA